MQVYAKVTNDIIVQTGRLIEGLPLPASLKDTPAKLRFDGQEFIRASDWTGAFFIDKSGTKHIADHEPDWQELNCDFDDELINDGGVWRVRTDSDRRLEAIKLECKKRIYAVASAEAQMNMVAAASTVSAKDAGSRTTEETELLASFAQSTQWVAAMRAIVQVLADDPEADIHTDGTWPECPAEVAALAADY